MSERSEQLSAHADGETIPGLLWTSAESDSAHDRPLVLIGHGRMMDKSNPWIVELARRFIQRGWNAVAIDAPGHGERRAQGSTDWPRPDPDHAAAGWQATVNLIEKDHGLPTNRLAYWGVSMGAALGISLIAGGLPVRAAVLGHLHANWPVPPGQRLRADAARLRLRVLFLANLDDTLVPIDSAAELFSIIGSEDKRLPVYPGDHAQLPTEGLDFADDFLARHT